jgi:hypothetical protein
MRNHSSNSGHRFVESVVSTAAGCAAATGAGAVASGIAYGGLSGAVIKAGVMVGVCNPPLAVAVVPVLASAAAISVVRGFFNRS